MQLSINWKEYAAVTENPAQLMLQEFENEPYYVSFCKAIPFIAA